MRYHLVMWHNPDRYMGKNPTYWDKKFKKGVKSIPVSKSKTTSTTIKKLTKGKKYCVDIFHKILYNYEKSYEVFQKKMKYLEISDKQELKVWNMLLAPVFCVYQP